MRIIETREKVNFVDKNNVLVGYDMSQGCCERAGYFIRPSEDNEILEGIQGDDFIQYIFDVDYFQNIEPKMEGSEEYKYSVLDRGRMVRFKLIAEGKPDLYLHLYNCQNGYYSHGFEADINGKKWQEGYC